MEEEETPLWMKELIMRKRATFGRAMAPAGVTGTIRGISWSSSSVQSVAADAEVRMRLLDADIKSELIIGTIGRNSLDKMVEEKPVKKTSFKDKKFIKMNGKEEEYQSDSSEELQYGPGIVNKLKSKYLSMTLRDNQKYSSRPSLNSLRRATSLENLIEEGLKEKPHFVKKTFLVKSCKISQHHAKYLGLTKGESMKRARSMDTLIKNDKPKLNGIPHSLTNDDLIIVDKEETDKELPPPDVVKQTLKIFEKGKVVQKEKPVQSPVHSPKPKPMLSPKPVLSPDKRIIRPKTSPKRIFPVVTKEKSAPTLSKEKPISPREKPMSPREKPVTPVCNKHIPINEKTASPGFREKPLSPKDKPLSPVIKENPLSPVVRDKPLSPAKDKPIKPISPEKTQFNPFDFMSKSTEKPPIPARKEESPKYVSKNALESISKEGMTMTFSFASSQTKNHLPKRQLNQATNPALLEQTVSPPPVKQVAVIRPVVNNKNLTERELEKNLINVVKSVELRNENDSQKQEKGQLWDKKQPWQNQNTMVFNFSNRQSVPDYIENDGLNMTPHRIPSKLNGARDECDGEDENWEPPSICNIRFVGDNVLINGKSNLRKEPRENKIRRIQFNDEATVLFEYPSEESMDDEELPLTTPIVNPTVSNIGQNLSSYTPSKTGPSESFELGVTRSCPIIQSNNSKQKIEDDYFKPVDSVQETTWSQETAADILF